MFKNRGEMQNGFFLVCSSELAYSRRCSIVAKEVTE